MQVLTGVIPDYTSMKFYVRGQNAKGVADLMAKVKDIFEAAAKATGCTVKYKTDKLLYDLRNNLQMSVSTKYSPCHLTRPGRVRIRHGRHEAPRRHRPARLYEHGR